MVNYYIGADVHCNNTEMAIIGKRDNLKRYSIPTTIPAIRQVLGGLPGVTYLTFEEGPMAGWLYRQLKDHVDHIIVSDPRRNRLISAEEDKNDPLVAAKLAHLLKGGYLHSVYHSDNEDRLHLKHWVALYHDRIHDAVRHINKIRARCRMEGVRIPRAVIRDVQARRDWLAQLKDQRLACQLDVIWDGYDITADQARRAQGHMVKLSRSYKIIQYWTDLPGVGIIRATTIFAYLDIPWRFRKKNQLWKYCGLGIQQQTSGTDRYGRPKPARLKLAHSGNRMLKDAIMGAAITAIRMEKNIFYDYYERRLRHGTVRSNARHTVARQLLTVMWGMWKYCRPFNQDLYLRTGSRNPEEDRLFFRTKA